MTAEDPFRRRRRRATATMAGILVAALLVGSLVLWQGVAALRRYEAARNVTRAMIEVPKTWTGLWATVDASEQLGSLTAVVQMPGAANGGHLVSIPINGDGLGSDDARSFRKAFANGGAGELQFAVEAALNLTFDFVQVSAPADFAALLAPVSPTEVTLASDVPTVTPPIKAGTASFNGEQLAAVLNSHPGSAGEPSRAANLLAVWKGVAAAVGTGKTTAPAGVAPTSFAELLQHVLAGPVDSVGLSTLPLGPDRASTEPDLAIIDLAWSVVVFGAIAPSNMSAPSPGLIYRIEAPPGNEARVYDAITTLTYLGGNVTQVSLSGPTLTATRVALNDKRDRATSEHDNALFGQVEYVTNQQPISGIDVVLSLGQSYLSRPRPDGATSTTSLPSSTATTPSPTDPTGSPTG